MFKNCVLFLLTFSCLISCAADKKHMPKEAIDAKVKRRSLQDAIKEVNPLLQKYQQLNLEEMLLFQDISSDIIAQIPDATDLELEEIKKIFSGYVHESYFFHPLQSYITDKNFLSLNAQEELSENFQFSLSPKKHVVFILKSYCLNKSYASPNSQHIFLKTPINSETPLRLIISYHESQFYKSINYQHAIWEVENENLKWKNISQETKNIFLDLNFNFDGELTLKEIANLDVVKNFIDSKKLTEKKLENIEIQWRAFSLSEGYLSVYNNSEQDVVVNSTNIIGRYTPVDQFISNIRYKYTSQIEFSRDIDWSKDNNELENSCELYSQNLNDTPYKIQNIWVQKPILVRTKEYLQRFITFTKDMLDAKEVLRNKNEKMLRDFLSVNAELFSNGVYDLPSQNIRNIKYTHMSLNSDLSYNLLYKILGYDLYKDSISLEEFFTFAKFIGEYKIPVQRLLDALSRKKKVSKNIYKFLLSLDKIKANMLEINELEEYINQHFESQNTSSSLSLNSEKYFGWEKNEKKNDITITFKGRNITYYLPEMMTVLKHPSLIPHIKSFWEIKQKAYENAVVKAGCIKEPSLEDGYYDAYRHALWSGLMMLEHGLCKSLWVGNGHEEHIVGGNNPLRKEMDLFNNKLGIKIAANLYKSLQRKPTLEELSEEIIKSLNRGEGKIIEKEIVNGKAVLKRVISSEEYEPKCVK